MHRGQGHDRAPQEAGSQTGTARPDRDGARDRPDVRRGGFDLDAAAAIFDAHNALLVLTPEEGAALWALGDSSIPLPAGPGFFVGESRVVGDIQPPVIICRTWLHNDQVSARRAANAEAWRLLLAKSWD